MPNHITNKLIINGEKQFIEQVIGSYHYNDNDNDNDNNNNHNNNHNTFTFKRTVPEPEEANTQDNWDWYTWRCNNWGTKWDANQSNLYKVDNREIILTFQTAWSPPDKWLQKTVKLFPQLSFRLSWFDEDYPTSGLYLYESTNNQFKYFNYYDDEGRNFIKNEFPNSYTMYENFHRINYLEKELNDCIQEFYPEVNIKIINTKLNDDNLEEPNEIIINYIQHDIDTNIDTNIIDTIDQNLKKQIMKKVKNIVLEHNYKTTYKGNILTVLQNKNKNQNKEKIE